MFVHIILTLNKKYLSKKKKAFKQARIFYVKKQNGVLNTFWTLAAISYSWLLPILNAVY